jgi:hypothetical protein
MDFWAVMPCIVVFSYQCFGDRFIQNIGTFLQTTQHYISEDHNVSIYHCENLIWMILLILVELKFFTCEEYPQFSRSYPIVCVCEREWEWEWEWECTSSNWNGWNELSIFLQSKKIAGSIQSIFLVAFWNWLIVASLKKTCLLVLYWNRASLLKHKVHWQMHDFWQVCWYTYHFVLTAV